MLIFATLERYVWITSPLANRILKKMFSRRGRYITMLTTLAICVALRLPLGWSIIVYEFPDCPDFFRTKMANVAEWASESYMYHVYDFHILGVAQTFLPFVVLVVLNVMVVRKMIRVRSQSTAPSARMSISVEASTPFCTTPSPSECSGAKAELATNGFSSLLVPSYAYSRNASIATGKLPSSYGLISI
uniref:G_PROTEIN_RECEP_F1_2 domain-containing protein n=1 Tax=Bursaphelenchus xylophilus TaxID=6326 RepID=A0A1I7SI51_BURXY